MKINISKFNLKNLDINTIINDNKQMIQYFDGSFKQFIFRNKNTEINNKNNIIDILKKKPRSFLTTLNVLVKTFKFYDKNLTTYLSHLNPKKVTELTKQPKKSKVININKLNNSKFNIITNKINILKNNLNKNKLSIPLHLLNPLLKSNSTSKYDLIKDFNKNQKYIELPKINLLLKENTYTLDSNLKTLDLVNFNILYKQQIYKFIELIKNYNSNNILPIKNTKFLKLITSLKIKNNFQQNIYYNFNINNNIKIKNIFILLEYAFRSMSCLISKPVFIDTKDKLIINLFYFLIPNKNTQSNNYKNLSLPIATSLNGIFIPSKKNQLTFKKHLKKNNKNNLLFNDNNIYKLNILSNILSRLFNKPIELDLIRLHLPFFDDNILVKAIGILSKNMHIRNILKFLFFKTNIHSNKINNFTNKLSLFSNLFKIAGIKIKIGGRLMTQKVIPRLTKITIQKGAIAKGKVNYVDWSRVNLKNKRGSYSITVTMSHAL